MVYQIDYNTIELITCIRDPYKRFISNFQDSNCETIKKFITPTKSWAAGHDQCFKINVNKFNYYVKMRIY